MFCVAEKHFILKTMSAYERSIFLKRSWPFHFGRIVRNFLIFYRVDRWSTLPVHKWDNDSFHQVYFIAAATKKSSWVLHDSRMLTAADT